MHVKFFIGLLLASLCAATQVFAGVFRPDKLAAMDAAIETAVASNKCPGGVLWLERDGTAYHKAFGNRALVPEREPMTEDTIFDAASLTKVAATTPVVMLLVERGQVKLDAPVRTYIPEFTGDGRKLVTVRELLTHTSGLPPDIETKTDWHGEAEAIKKTCSEKLESPPGTAFKYSDINFILLGEIVQRVSKTPLEIFVQNEIYGPVKMTDTGFLPPNEKLPRIAPARLGRRQNEFMSSPKNQSGDAGDLPGPTSATMLEEWRRYVIVDVHPFVVDLARCDGMWLGTVNGDRIFDWAGHYASKLVGHNHPGLAEPDCVQRLARAANNKVANPDFLTPKYLEYYRMVHRLTPRCMRNPKLEVYSVNSGAGKRAVVVVNQEFNKAITAQVELPNPGSLMMATSEQPDAQPTTGTLQFPARSAAVVLDQ